MNKTDTIYAALGDVSTIESRGDLFKRIKDTGHKSTGLIFNRICKKIEAETGRTLPKRKVEKVEAAKEVVLYSDAKAKYDRFGITDADGKPVWYGRFFDNDRDYNGEQSSGEMAAAKKAVWLASKIAEKIGEAVRLRLRVDAQWLCYANGYTGAYKESGGKALQLAEAAQRLGVDLIVEWVPGKENPADDYTICKGFQKWQDADLESLANATGAA